MTKRSIVPLLALLISGQLDAGLGRHEASEPHMGTMFRIVVYSECVDLAGKGLEEAFSRVSKLNSLLSDYLPDSELSCLSRTAGSGKSVPVSKELWSVLAHANDVSEGSCGAFDVTVGPYARLWKIARAKRELPQESRIKKFRESVGYRNIQFDNPMQAVRLKRDGMFLDLGGIAKGFAADEALRVLADLGMPCALVDAGGDLVLGDPPPGRKGWKIAVGGQVHPDLPVLELSNCAIATSGDTSQFVEIEGKRYSHIVNPHTGIGLTNRQQATVVAPSGTLADALASTGCILDPCKFSEVLKKFQGTHAYIIQESEADGKTLRMLP